MPVFDQQKTLNQSKRRSLLAVIIHTALAKNNYFDFYPIQLMFQLNESTLENFDNTLRHYEQNSPSSQVFPLNFIFKTYFFQSKKQDRPKTDDFYQKFSIKSNYSSKVTPSQVIRFFESSSIEILFFSIYSRLKIHGLIQMIME